MNKILAALLMFMAASASAALPRVGTPPGQRYMVSGASITAVDGNFSGSVTASSVTANGGAYPAFSANGSAGGVFSSPGATYLDSQNGTHFRIGGAEQMFIGVNAIGILAASPATNLDVNGSAQFGSGATKSTFTATGALDLAGNLSAPAISGITNSITFAASGQFIDFGPSGGVPLNFRDITNSYASSLYLKQGGGVGINTASPASTLDVNGDAQFGSGATKSTFTATGALWLHSASSMSLTGSAPSHKVDTGSYERIQNACGAAITCTATCSAGKQAIGGGCYVDQPLVRTSAGTPTSWTCETTVTTTALHTAMAICLSLN